ncbi:MAG: leucine dehydrogenase [Defluviitaleaceae bacterium]|nr:leucine dehydrogenase [Defluviitaleaceae bacterium]
MKDFKIFEYMEQYSYEQVNFFHHKESGLKAVTAVHNTVLGPALGGSRFWNYATEEEAIYDAMRLARGMTYKSSLAGINLGGGKTVIWGDVNRIKADPVLAESFWRAFGRYIESMHGRYITAADMNTGEAVLSIVNQETEHVVGLPGRSGNPSPKTARGTFRAIQACCEHLYGTKSTKGRTVAVQGVGEVGRVLCELLHEDGANLIITDINQDLIDRVVKSTGAKVVKPDEIYSVECDIYAPSAMGATVNKDTIPQLKCKIVCGAANNVLAHQDEDGTALHEKGILYAPDYLANAGGVINVFHELNIKGYNEENAIKDIDQIYDRMLDVLTKAKESGKPTYKIANEIAEARIAAMSNVNNIRTKGLV